MTVSADLAIQNPSLQINPGSGGPIQNTGCGDNDGIVLRTVADGTLPLNTNIDLVTQVPDGLVNVSGCTTVHCYVDFTKGSLTNAIFAPQWYAVKGGTAHQVINLEEDVATGIVVLPVKQTFAPWTANLTGVFSLPNPGANWFKVNIDANGTVTSSSLAFIVTRGWGSAQDFHYV